MVATAERAFELSKVVLIIVERARARRLDPGLDAAARRRGE
jgi:hypothetical protein